MCVFVGERVFMVTVSGQSVWLSRLGVSGVDGRLLHAAELGLAGVRRHGRGRRRGENVRVRPEVEEEDTRRISRMTTADEDSQKAAFSL